jgi:hypothetical protein
MPDPEQNRSNPRQFPPLYERIIPIALAILIGAIIVMLLVILAVVIGVFPGPG